MSPWLIGISAFVIYVVYSVVRERFTGKAVGGGLTWKEVFEKPSSNAEYEATLHKLLGEVKLLTPAEARAEAERLIKSLGDSSAPAMVPAGQAAIASQLSADQLALVTRFPSLESVLPDITMAPDALQLVDASAGGIRLGDDGYGRVIVARPGQEDVLEVEEGVMKLQFPSAWHWLVYRLRLDEAETADDEDDDK